MSTAGKPKVCFVIGPMKDVKRLNRLAHEIVGPLVADLGYAVTTPYQLQGGHVMNNVITLLDRADLLIADLTHNNPNVFYELGIRHCLGLPYVSVREKIKHAPFDIAAYHYTEIDIGDVAGAQEMLRPLIQAVHDDIARCREVSNPVTDFYHAPLTEISPAVGLALGYYRNLVRPVIQMVQMTGADDEQFVHSLAVGGLPITDWDVRMNVKLEIIIPTTLTQAAHGNIQSSVLRKKHLIGAVVGAKPRDRTLYARPEGETDCRLVDIPTTLIVMEETICQRLQRRNIDRGSDEWKVLEHQEIERFGSALQRLLRNEEEDAIRAAVEIRGWCF